MSDLMTIGDVADAVGVTTSTLRYYDNIGLVEPATRVSGQRRYDRPALHRLRIIDSFQRAGFTLDEIGQLLDGLGDWQQLAHAKRQHLQLRINELQQGLALVDNALACGCEPVEGCDRDQQDTTGSPDPSRARLALTDPTRP